MAKSRMVAREITIDKDVAKLSDKAALLYTWLIPFLDREGRFFALPEQIKGYVIPYRKNFTVNVVRQCLKEIASVDLIRIYGENGEYLCCKGFLKHNKPHPNEPESQIPPYKSKLT